MNTLAKNLITKGWLNISILTKGFILPSFKYIVKRKGGSSYSGYNEQELYKTLHKINTNDIDCVDIVVKWDKINDNKYNQQIYAELIEKKIEVILLKENINDIKINVKLI